MPSKSVFHWPDARGWLVLSGGADATSEIRALALARASADGAAVYVALAGGESAERALEDMEDLGAPSGYIVDVASEDDQTVTARLTDAGLIVIEGAATASESRSALLGAAIDGIQAAYENGAVILAEGSSAMAFGAWVVRQDGSLVPGLEWLQGGLIAPGVVDAAAWGREALLAQPLAYVVGIGPSSALALGPDGEVEAWGKQELTIALGRNYTSTQADQ